MQSGIKHTCMHMGDLNKIQLQEASGLKAGKKESTIIDVTCMQSYTINIRDIYMTSYVYKPKELSHHFRFDEA